MIQSHVVGPIFQIPKELMSTSFPKKSDHRKFSIYYYNYVTLELHPAQLLSLVTSLRRFGNEASLFHHQAMRSKKHHESNIPQKKKKFQKWVPHTVKTNKKTNFDPSKQNECDRTKPCILVDDDDDDDASVFKTVKKIHHFYKTL